MFGGFGFKNNEGLARDENIERIRNLLAGVELLSLGITFHRFCADGIKTFSSKASDENEEKKYNIDLLFGDVFYSRAVPYLLRFKDHKVFERILKSLKNTHRNRLELHLELLKYIENGSKDISRINKNKDLFLGINSLLESSFKVGQSIFDPENIAGDKKAASKIIEHIIILKFYNDLENYFCSIPQTSRPVQDMDFIHDKISFNKNRLNDNISELKSGELADNFRVLVKIV